MKALMNARALLTLLVATALGGCADLRLYNAGQDEVAKKAATAITEADIGKSLVKEREAIAALSKSEQDAVRRDQLGRRDRKLILWLSATSQGNSWDEMDRAFNARITALSGAVDLDKLKRIEGNNAVLKSSREQFSTQAQSLLGATGGVVLTCPVQKSQHYPLGSEEEILLRPAFNACKNMLEAQKNLAADAIAAGQIARLGEELKGIETEQKAIAEKLDLATQRYNKALKTLKEKSTADASATAGVKKALQDLESLPPAEKIEKITENPVLSHLVDVGKIEQLEKKRELVRELLTALDTGKAAESAGDDQKKAAAIGAAWHAISDKPVPPLSGILIESEFLRQEINGLKMQVNRAKQLIELKQAKLASMHDELRFLNDADKAKQAYAAESAKCPAMVGQSIYQAWQKATTSCRSLLAQRLINVLNAMTFGEAQQELIDYQLIALGHDDALDASEVAINQVDTLVRVPMTQLQKAYGSGITPQHISNLINALGLGAIAKGVN